MLPVREQWLLFRGSLLKSLLRILQQIRSQVNFITVNVSFVRLGVFFVFCFCNIKNQVCSFEVTPPSRVPIFQSFLCQFCTYMAAPEWEKRDSSGGCQ